MTAMELTTPYRFADSRLANFCWQTLSGPRLLTISAVLMLFGFIVCTGLQFFDDRLLLGVSVWEIFFSHGYQIYLANFS